MKAAFLLLLAVLCSAAQAEDVVVWVPAASPPPQVTSSTATLTPEGVYWTFNSARSSVTLTPLGALPLAVALLTTLPASTSAWVRV